MSYLFKSRLLREEIYKWMLIVALFAWAVTATTVAFSKQEKILLIGTSDQGSFLISRTEEQVLEKERLELLKKFLSLYYSVDPSSYLERVSQAGDLMSKEFWEVKRSSFLEIKKKLDENPLTQTSRIKSIDLIGENVFEVVLELTVFQKLSENKTLLRSTVQLERHNRTEINPWPYEVVEVKDELL